MTRAILLATILATATATATAQPAAVKIFHDERGFKLQVDGRDFMVRGMNWSYTPIGENYRYSLWTQPDWVIEEALRREMRLLKDMGVNAIRQTADIPPRWVEWIYRHYGIYTVLNPLMGRYGIDTSSGYVANVNYASRAHRQAILQQLGAALDHYRGTPGVLMWMLGNENNYGLAWTSFEIGNLPRSADDARAEFLYSLFGEAIGMIKARDPGHPVMIANGDVQYLDLIAKHCKGLDVFGANVYRGPSARDLFERVKKVLDVPVLFSEFGSDAFNARLGHEDPQAQAEILLSQWQEIYQQAYGQGRAGNAIGGFIFQWTDGWWKTRQEINLDVHDTTATWANDAYAFDYTPGENNMNEEWFGITALGMPDANGLHHVRPRTAYYVLAQAFKLDPYADDTTPEKIHSHYEAIRPEDFAQRYQANEALAKVNMLEWIRLSNVRLNFDSSMSQGNAQAARGATRVFDHTESFFTDFVLQPTANVYARLSVNIVGNAAQNRLDPIYYENRTRVAASTVNANGTTTAMMGGAMPGTTTMSGTTATGTTLTTANAMTDLQRVAVYQAEINIDQKYFSVEGYYRTGHNHWGDEGDLFGLYRSAYYGPNIDIYNGTAPFGAVITGHKFLEGLKIAIGPEIYWGANPSLIAKYRRTFGPVTLTLVHEEDLAHGSGTQTSSVIREPPTRRTTLALEVHRSRVFLQLGGIFAGSTKVDTPFLWARPTAGRGYLDSGYDVLYDKIQWADTFGGKLKLTLDLGRLHWFVQAQMRGLVADGGPDPMITLTDFSMKESGRGNHVGGETGVTVDVGALQLGTKFLYQHPLIGPNPQINDYYSNQTGLYYPAVRPRNVLSDPFAVRENRETEGFELLLVYDPTPITWFFAWDRELHEDARFAASLDAVYRIQPTSQDSGIAILADGSLAPFGGAPPPHNTWDVTLRFVTNPGHRIRLSGTAYAAQKQTTGIDPRLVTAFGGEAKLWWRTWLLWTILRFDDWGPYDYQRDFNLTFPVQWYGDLSYGVTSPLPRWLGSRVGLRAQVRELDGHSENYVLDPAHPGAVGLEWELGAYVHLSL
jgi:beta-galactosidase